MRKNMFGSGPAHQATHAHQHVHFHLNGYKIRVASVSVGVTCSIMDVLLIDPNIPGSQGDVLVHTTYVIHDCVKKETQKRAAGMSDVPQKLRERNIYRIEFHKVSFKSTKPILERC